MDLAIQTLNRVGGIFHASPVTWDYHIILPVGISFYTLQSLGYLIDVYRGEIYVEKNFLRYALFVSFFPQLVAGPIERSKNLLKQLGTKHRLTYYNIRDGILLILYGLFLKMVIADRAAVWVDEVYSKPDVYQGFYIIFATILFAIQIYCDFYGYSTIARGSAQLMGISLMDNFNAPYYSKSVKEFWRRWHISLSSWFRDYLYIPLGGNRKGTIRKRINLMIVFTVSGLWHGASLAYIFWGMLNGIYQVAAEIKDAGKHFIRRVLKLPEGKDTFSARAGKTAITFFLVTFAWLFFRAGGFHAAMEVLTNMAANMDGLILFDGSLYGLGVDRQSMYIMFISIAVLFAVDHYKYRGVDVLQKFWEQGYWLKAACIVGMILTITLYGCYGTMYDVQQFIYFQF